MNKFVVFSFILVIQLWSIIPKTKRCLYKDVQLNTHKSASVKSKVGHASLILLC